MFAGMPDPILLIVGLSVLSLAPFVVIMTTCFVKLVVVFSLVRNALGLQQIPPNLVINGLAVILTFFIMAPVASDIYDIAKAEDYSDMSLGKAMGILDKVKEPWREFLERHAEKEVRVFFLKSAKTLWPPEKSEGLTTEDLVVLIPAFTVSELSQAFRIGFLLYLPFVAIDLIISNLLMAMGMMMVSPMTISLPFKLMLFVALEGWLELIEGLILTYK